MERVKRAMSFEGEATRREWWMIYLASMGYMLVATLAVAIAMPIAIELYVIAVTIAIELFGEAAAVLWFMPWYMALVAYYAPAVWVFLAVSARRLRHRRRDPWLLLLLLLTFIPLFGWLVFLWLFIEAGFLDKPRVRVTPEAVSYMTS